MSTSGYTLVATVISAMGEEEEKAQEETELTVPILKSLIIQSEGQNPYMKLMKNNFNYPNLGEGRGSSMSM